MSANHWTCIDDVDWDLDQLSDFYVHTDTHIDTPNERVPKTRTKVKPSIHDDPEDEEEVTSAITHRLGRGYPVLTDFQLQNLRKPGGIPTFLQKQNQTSKEIREVFGVGFSNNVIEHSLGADQLSSFKNGLSSTPHTSSSEVSSSSSSPKTIPAETKSHAPPPLFDILKINQDKTKKSLKPSQTKSAKTKTSLKPDSDGSNVFQPVAKLPVDINSKIEFPELKAL